jgi:GntR family transcriptional regulator
VPEIGRSVGVPLYQQLRSILSARLRHGDWKPNDKLPTEDELAVQFGVSKATVRQALRDLTQAGLLRREQGRGTFVADDKVRFGPRHLTSFTEEMQLSGVATRSRVLERAVVAAGAAIANRLQVKEGSDLFRLRRLRLAGDEPMAIQTAHVACHLAPNLFETHFETASLYDTLERRYGLVLYSAEQIHSAASAGRDEAGLLRVPEGTAVLACERLTFMRNGMPLELTQSIMRGDRYQIHLRLLREQVR